MSDVLPEDFQAMSFVESELDFRWKCVAPQVVQRVRAQSEFGRRPLPGCKHHIGECVHGVFRTKRCV